MKTGYIVLISIILLVVISVSWVWSSHNKMVGKDQEASGKWADVQAAYQRRMDLIPNLVSTVQGAANFEKSTLTAVIEARAKATSVTIDPSHMTADNLKQFDAAQGQVTSSLSRLLVAVEQYPDIKATQNFRDLQSQLEGTENRINVARQRFNDAVQDYDSYIKFFPQNLFSSSWGFQERPYFTADQAASKAPEVKF